ncbi:hypothetical protein JWH17_11350 [Desulfobulbus marinus]|nr:hypothetical protein [Desulfogranum marinum]
MMYGESDFTVEKYTFTPEEKFFAVIDLTEIPPGEYLITIDWQNPTGQIARQSSHSLLLEDPKDHFRLYSWLKLWKNGFLTRSFTGREFNDNYFGEWHLAVYVNGQLVVRQQFQVT